MNMNYKELSLSLDYKVKQQTTTTTKRGRSGCHKSDKSRSTTPAEAMMIEGDERFKSKAEFESDGGGNGGQARPLTPSRHWLEKRPGGYFP